MIDTIELSVSDTQLINTVILPRIEIVKKYESDQTYLGNIKNFTIRKYGTTIKIIGSLSTYYFGTNQKTMNIKQVIDAVNRLIKDLGSSPEKIFISSIDIGFNLVVKHDPIYYTRGIKRARGYSHSHLYKTGSTFDQEYKKLLIYNKTEETVKRKNQLPALSNVNLLRYELRLKYLKRILDSSSDITLKKLKSTAFIGRLIVLWLKEYDKVVKPKSIIGQDFLKSQKVFNDYLLALGIQAMGGEVELLSLISSITSEKKYTAQLKNKLKLVVTKITSKPELFKKTDYVMEMDKLVKQTAIHFLSNKDA